MTYTNHYISLNPYRGTIVIKIDKKDKYRIKASIPIKEQLLLRHIY